ncbi:hypothetical protein ACVV2G_14000 [Streptomyces ziwulingensis]
MALATTHRAGALGADLVAPGPPALRALSVLVTGTGNEIPVRS